MCVKRSRRIDRIRRETLWRKRKVFFFSYLENFLWRLIVSVSVWLSFSRYLSLSPPTLPPDPPPFPPLARLCRFIRFHCIDYWPISPEISPVHFTFSISPRKTDSRVQDVSGLFCLWLAMHLWCARINGVWRNAEFIKWFSARECLSKWSIISLAFFRFSKFRSRISVRSRVYFRCAKRSMHLKVWKCENYLWFMWAECVCFGMIALVFCGAVMCATINMSWWFIDFWLSSNESAFIKNVFLFAYCRFLKIILLLSVFVFILRLCLCLFSSSSFSIFFIFFVL